MTDSPGPEGERFLDVELPHSFRGVDPEAVQALLTEAKEALRQAEDRERELRTTVASLAAELDEARADAMAELDEAKRRGREMVTEAQTVRRRILEDLVRRRTALRRQIEQLRVGRERLLEVYEVVGQTVEEATQELNLALPAAQAAAQRAGRRVGPDPTEVSAEDLHAMEAEIDAARAAGLPILDPPSPAERAASRSAGAPEGGGEDEVPTLAEVESVVASFEEVRVLEPAGEEADAPAADGDDEPPTVGDAVEEAGDGSEEVVPAAVEEAPDEEPDQEPRPEAEPPPAVTAAAADDALVLPLFDRLRATEPEPAPAPSVADALEASPEPLPDEPTDAVTVLAQELARRLRRALADEQNQVLDRLRQDRQGRLDPVAALGDPDALLVRLATAVEPELREAAADVGGDAAVAEQARDLATAVVDGVGADVAARGAGAEGADERVRCVREAFRGWRTDRILPHARAAAEGVLGA